MKIEAALAVHAHRLHLAYTAEENARAHREEVERRASEDSFPILAWVRTRQMLTVQPEELEKVERHASLILLSIRAALSVEEPRIYDAVRDEEPAERLERLTDEGYFAAVMGRPCDGDVYQQPGDRAAWIDGWHGFRCDLAEFERGLAVASAARCIVPDCPVADPVRPDAGARS